MIPALLQGIFGEHSFDSTLVCARSCGCPSNRTCGGESAGGAATRAPALSRGGSEPTAERGDTAELGHCYWRRPPLPARPGCPRPLAPQRSNSSPRCDPPAAPPPRPRRAATPLAWGRGRARPTSVPPPRPQVDVLPKTLCATPEAEVAPRSPRPATARAPQPGGRGRPGARRGHPGARERGASPPEAAPRLPAPPEVVAAAVAGGVDGPRRPERPWRRAAAPTGGPGRGPQVTCARPPGPGRAGQRGRGPGGGVLVWGRVSAVTPAPGPAGTALAPGFLPRGTCVVTASSLADAGSIGPQLYAQDVGRGPESPASRPLSGQVRPHHATRGQR